MKAMTFLKLLVLVWGTVMVFVALSIVALIATPFYQPAAQFMELAALLVKGLPPMLPVMMVVAVMWRHGHDKGVRGTDVEVVQAGMDHVRQVLDEIRHQRLPPQARRKLVVRWRDEAQTWRELDRVRGEYAELQQRHERAGRENLAELGKATKTAVAAWMLKNGVTAKDLELAKAMRPKPPGPTKLEID